jgi:hypothetical protein
MSRREYHIRQLSLDVEGELAWQTLKQNWIMSKLLNNILISFEKNFSRYQHYIDLELLPKDTFDKLTDGELEWANYYNHFKKICWRKSTDEKNKD